MQRLILLRHAEAEQSSTGGDFDRALTARGRRDARGAGETLAALGLEVDLVIVSAAKRALETWEEARPSFPHARVEVAPSLYNGEPANLWAAAEDAEAERVLVIAHNPGMHELVLELLTRADALDQVCWGFPPAAAAAFTFDEGRPRFEAFHNPPEGAR